MFLSYYILNINRIAWFLTFALSAIAEWDSANLPKRKNFFTKLIFVKKKINKQHFEKYFQKHRFTLYDIFILFKIA